MAGTCPICEKRRGKRFCPGLAGSRWAGRGQGETICAPCCGEQREVTIDCPAHCPHLQSAHRYEGERRTAPVEPAFPQVNLDPGFLEDHQLLLAGLSLTLVGVASQHSAVRDADLLAALDALARSYQTRDSGLYYDQKPETPGAQALAAAAEEFLGKFSSEQQQHSGQSLRPNEALRVLVFLRRLGQVHGNGRPLSRRFLESLRRMLPAEAAAPGGSRLIVPGG